MTVDITPWVNRRLEEILEYPTLWAASAEALELQVLTLLEVRDVAAGLKDERHTLDAYAAFIIAYYKGVRPTELTQAAEYLYKFVKGNAS